MWTRKELKTRAKDILRISYWKAFLVSLIIAFVGGNGGGGFSIPNFNSGGIGRTNTKGMSADFKDIWHNDYFPWIAGIFLLIVIVVLLFVLAFRVFLFYPLEVGSRRYFIQAAQHNNNMNYLEYGFRKGKYIAILKAMFWRGLFNFLWYLLLIIPGIVKSYAYRMVPYILADNANIGYKRALELSNRMTSGQKFRMWVLDLSFIGWYLLGMLALLVGVLFVMPYENATKAELYLVLRQHALDNRLCTEDELNLTIQ